MTLKTQLDADLAIFFDVDDFADDATYTPKGGVGLAIKAIPTFNRNLEQVAKGQKESADFVVRKDQVSSPKFGDTITHNAIVWTIESVGSGGDGRVTMIMCRRAERVSFAKG